MRKHFTQFREIKEDAATINIAPLRGDDVMVNSSELTTQSTSATEISTDQRRLIVDLVFDTEVAKLVIRRISASKL
jgi:hypothetical protein